MRSLPLKSNSKGKEKRKNSYGIDAGHETPQRRDPEDPSDDESNAAGFYSQISKNEKAGRKNAGVFSKPAGYNGISLGKVRCGKQFIFEYKQKQYTRYCSNNF